MTVSSVTLNNGVTMPQVGFGVWQVADDAAEVAVTTALKAGYRSIDTAKLYYNEAGVGRATAASGIARDELFITTKLWNSDHDYDTALKAFDVSLALLGLDVVDLYLIHWPVPSSGRYVQAWKALQTLYAEGRVRAIGVANFTVDTLKRILQETDVVPSVNQIELHPRLAQVELRAFHAAHGIVTEAWSPLGQGGDLLDDPVLARIGAKHTKTAAQVVLRWHLQIGNVVIPKSVTPARIAENIDVFDFALDDDDLAAIDGLNTGERLGPDPATFNWMG